MLILIMFIHQLDWKERESNRSHAGPEWDPFSARECKAQDQPTTNPHPTPSHRGGIWINDISVS